MQHQDIKAVLFDFGGVLAEEGFRNGLIAFAYEQGLDVDAMPQLATQAVYESGFVIGKGTVSDFWALLRERSGLKGEDNVLTKRILDGFVVRPWMMEIVHLLREKGFITAILSDQTDWLDWLDAQYHFYTAFDHIFNSYYLGKGKQDISLFEDIAAQLDLEPASLLFIDDNEENIARARKAGWQVLHYVEQAPFLVEMKKLLE